MNVLSKRVAAEFAQRPTSLITKPEISVLLPAYNEAETISNVVKSYYNEICDKLCAELIVAEDGSTDGTKEVLASLRQELPVVVISDANRKGYAKGVSDALMNCEGDWIFFSDSDGQYFSSDFWNLWKNRNGFDMIIGRKVHRNEEAYRLILAKGFHKIINGIFNLNLHDADCGFRLIRKEVVLSILDDIKHLKYSFWAEFTIKACYKGFKICEVPINHNNRANGNTHIYELAEIPTIVLKQLNGLLSLHFDINTNR